MGTWLLISRNHPNSLIKRRVLPLNGLSKHLLMLHPVNPSNGNVPNLILLCLMPDDFTHHGESAVTQFRLIQVC